MPPTAIWSISSSYLTPTAREGEESAVMDEKLRQNEKWQSPPAFSDVRVYEDIHAALTKAQTSVVVAANAAMVRVYWEIGRRISETVGNRAEYGRSLLTYLS